MKRSFITVTAAILLAVPSINAQSIAVGANVGSEGAGAQIAVGLTPSMQVRAGYSYMPYSLIGEQNVDFKAWDVHPAGNTTLTEQKIRGSASVLFDFFPFPGSPFRFTAGSMIGGGTLFQVTNTKAMPDSYHTSGMTYHPNGSGSPTKIYADAGGIYVAEVRRNAVRPYVGIGFGNPFSKTFGVSVDLGVQYTGGLGLYTDPSQNGNSDFSLRLDTEGVQKLAYDMRGSTTQKGYDKYFKYIDKLNDIPVMPVVRINFFFGFGL